MSENWMHLDYDPMTRKTTYIRVLENGDIQIKAEIPREVLDGILEDNKRKRKYFDEMGGWKKAKNGAVFAAIPHYLDQHFKQLSGFDPAKGGEYDRDKYNSFLDDSDFSALRTAGGKIGKRKANAPALTKAFKESLLVGVAK